MSHLESNPNTPLRNLKEVKQQTSHSSKAKSRIQVGEAHSCDDVEERQSKKRKNEKNSFHTHLLVNGKVCSLRINEVRCPNATSPILVNKLGLHDTSPSLKVTIIT